MIGGALFFGDGISSPPLCEVLSQQQAFVVGHMTAGPDYQSARTKGRDDPGVSAFVCDEPDPTRCGQAKRGGGKGGFQLRNATVLKADSSVEVD